MIFNEKELAAMDKMLVRFPNESYPVEVPHFRWRDFQVTSTMQDEVFGRWRGELVAISREAFEGLKPSSQTGI
jgi:hypothetical protein